MSVQSIGQRPIPNRHEVPAKSMGNFTALETPTSGLPIEQRLPLKRAADAFSEQATGVTTNLGEENAMQKMLTQSGDGVSR